MPTHTDEPAAPGSNQPSVDDVRAAVTKVVEQLTDEALASIKAMRQRLDTMETMILEDGGQLKAAMTASIDLAKAVTAQVNEIGNKIDGMRDAYKTALESKP